MILPMSVTQNADRCSGCAAGSIRLRIGNSRNAAMAKPPSARRRGEVKFMAPTQKSGTDHVFHFATGYGKRGLSLIFSFGSCLDRPSLQREQSLRPALDEDDDEDEQRDLRQHRA